MIAALIGYITKRAAIEMMYRPADDHAADRPQVGPALLEIQRTIDVQTSLAKPLVVAAVGSRRYQNSDGDQRGGEHGEIDQVPQRVAAPKR